MWGHREDLIKRLDHVLVQLDRGAGYLDQEKPGVGEEAIEQAKKQYMRLRDVLLKIDMEAVEILTRSHSTFNCALSLPSA